MRKDRLLIAVLVVCFVLVVGALFFLEGVDVDGLFGESDSDNADSDADSDVYSDVDSEVVLDDAGASSSSGGGSGLVDENGVVYGDDGSVVDVDEAECGFYFEEYGVCGGTCPSGECVSEGRSCYCKDL